MFRGFYKIFTASALAMGSAACDVDAVTARDGEQSSRVATDGYDTLKFGMLFEEAIALLRADYFNPASYLSCYERMEIEGCALYRSSSPGAVYARIDGIPYGLNLHFNRKAELFEIGLTYEKEGGISRDECVAIYSRTLDWVSSDYGALRSTEASQNDDTELTPRVTPNGIEHQVYLSADGSFMGMRDVGTQKDAEIFVMGSFIAVGEGVCRVQFEMQSNSIEREDPSAA